MKLQQARPMNEAARQLRGMLVRTGMAGISTGTQRSDTMVALLDAALATADRLAVQRTVERIKRVTLPFIDESDEQHAMDCHAALHAILDDIAGAESGYDHRRTVSPPFPPRDRLDVERLARAFTAVRRRKDYAVWPEQERDFAAAIADEYDR